MAWILRLVKTGAEGDGQSTDVMQLVAGFSDWSNLSLYL